MLKLWIECLLSTLFFYLFPPNKNNKHLLQLSNLSCLQSNHSSTPPHVPRNIPCSQQYSLEEYLYFQILHFHIFLAVQDLLCVWFHATCVCHHDSGHCLRHNCLHVLSTQLRRLSMVSCRSLNDSGWIYKCTCSHLPQFFLSMN